MTRTPSAPLQRGFTIVELLMSLAVLAVGISGVIAMQKVTATSNVHSKSVAIATQIANAWQDQLLVDGTLWRTSTGLTSTARLAPTRWLQQVNTNANAWFAPANDTIRLFGSGFDALGNPVANMNLAQFCVHLLLAPSLSLTTGDPGNSTIRATVRVMWPRIQGTQTASGNFCNLAPAVIGDDTANYHVLYQTLAIRIHP